MIDIIKTITGLTADTRDVKPGYLFAALRGTRFDGVDFIPQAITNGATHILAPTGTQVENAPDDVTVIESDHPRRDFAALAAAFYDSQPDTIIAVTGTNGKTSVADFIRQIAEYCGVKSASLGTLGLVSKHTKGHNIMTTPDPVKLHSLLSDLQAAGVTHLAMEASSHGLDQYRLHGVRVKVAAFTNLSQDHLDYHGTMADYFAAKSRLFTEILDKDNDGGVAVVNADDQWAQQIPRQNLTFGEHEAATMRLIKQTPNATGQQIDILYEGEKHSIPLNLIGRFQAYNILCAALCSIATGLDAADVFAALPQLQGVKGRVELAAAYDGCAAYIDYAHTPDALEKILTALRPHVAGRLICVFGAGGDRDKGKRPQMGRIAAVYADHVIVTDDNPRSENPEAIRQDILSACPNADTIGDRRAAITRGVEMLHSGDILIVAGKGHEQGQIIGDEILPFDDMIETQQAMKNRFEI